MPDATKILRKKIRNAVMTEQPRRMFFDEDITDNTAVNAKIQDCAEIISVCEFLGKFG